MNVFDFKITPTLGRTIKVESQRYVLLETRLHQRADDTFTMVLTWQSHCPVCSKPFAFTTGLKAQYVDRRCEAHKTPGRPVRFDRRVRKGGRHD